ncbi:replication-relaxation family protein [Parafrigoribacterium humi]|uniref:replication-relaxation family protein n=1 Tax=Parafrigoribacterium humi TaxID=3144664 RepID=UPI0032EA9A39
MTPNNRLGTYSIAMLQSMVTPRDMEILRLIREHRFLTTKQIQRLLFWDHASPGAAIRACIRVMTRLELRALIFKLSRQIGGIHAGSGSYIWGIDDAGDRLLRAEKTTKNTKRQRTFDPSALFLAHTLAVAETRVMLEEAAHRSDLELVTVTTEPTNWRTFVGRGGTAQILKPDLHAVTAVGEYEDHWFIEIDNGTESLPTVIGKCKIYQRYFESGREQTDAGVFPKVVWLMVEARRREHLMAAIKADKLLDERLFCAVAPGKFIDLVSGRSTPDTAGVKTIPQHQTSGLLRATELSSGGQSEGGAHAAPNLATRGREATQ